MCKARIFSTFIYIEQQAKLANFVGERFVLSCIFDSVKVEALHITGAQVSTIGKNWYEKSMCTREIIITFYMLDDAALSGLLLCGVKIVRTSP